MAASILKGALPNNENGAMAEEELIATSEDDYEEKAVALGKAFTYIRGGNGKAEGRLVELSHGDWVVPDPKTRERPGTPRRVDNGRTSTQRVGSRCFAIPSPRRREADTRRDCATALSASSQRQG